MRRFLTLAAGCLLVAAGGCSDGRAGDGALGDAEGESQVEKAANATNTENAANAARVSPEQIRAVVDEMVSQADDPGELAQSNQLLPDLFEPPGDKDVQVSGSVLTREDAEKLQDTVDGVELKLEMKTK